MTLIVGLVNERRGGATLLGDLLVSTRDLNRTEGAYPSKPKSSAVMSHYSIPISVNISGLAQKIHIITERLVVGAAGDECQIVDFLNYIRGQMRVSKRADDGNEVSNIVKDYLAFKPAFSHEISLIFLFRDNNDFVRVIANNFGHQVFNQLGLVFAVGSGYSDFFEYVAGLGAKGTREIMRHSEGIWPDVNFLMRFVGSSQSRQKGAGYGLNRLWGGGFELAHRTKTGFTKLDRIFSQTLWYQRTSKGIDIFPMQRTIQQYDGMNLVIKSSKMDLNCETHYVVSLFSSLPSEWREISHNFDAPTYTTILAFDKNSDYTLEWGGFNPEGDQNISFGDPMDVNHWITYDEKSIKMYIDKHAPLFSTATSFKS